MGMTSLETRFHEFANYIKCLDGEQRQRYINPGTRLKLYGLFQQSTKGNCNVRRPWFFGKAKWDHWNELRGIEESEAMKQYIQIVTTLRSTIDEKGTT